MTVKLKDIRLSQARQMVIDHAKMFEAFYRSWAVKNRPVASHGLMASVRVLIKKEKAGSKP